MTTVLHSLLIWPFCAKNPQEESQSIIVTYFVNVFT